MTETTRAVRKNQGSNHQVVSNWEGGDGFWSPENTFVDSGDLTSDEDGNIYIADFGNNES